MKEVVIVGVNAASEVQKNVEKERATGRRGGCACWDGFYCVGCYVLITGRTVGSGSGHDRVEGGGG